MTTRPIYLDYSATTPVDPRVVDKMVPWLYENFGNPASRSHAFGWESEDAVERAREEVAKLVNADPREIVWTSGATESDNLAIKGAANFYAEGGKHHHRQDRAQGRAGHLSRAGTPGLRGDLPDVKENGLIDLDVFRPRCALTPCWSRS